MTDHSKEGLVDYEYDCAELGVVLTCWFEYEAAERGSWSEGLQVSPDYPAYWTLMHVYLPGSEVDIASVMRSDLAEEIEEWVAEKADRDYEDSRWDAAIEAYEDRKAGY